MQVTDKDVADLLSRYIVKPHLNLCAFTTIDEKMPVLNGEILCRRKSAEGWQCPTGAKDGEFK